MTQSDEPMKEDLSALHVPLTEQDADVLFHLLRAGRLIGLARIHGISEVA